VLNIEIVAQDWYKIVKDTSTDLLVPFGDDEAPCIGLTWSPKDGFEQPEIEEFPVDISPELSELNDIVDSVFDDVR